MSTWVHAWSVLHKISKSSLLHVRHGNNVGHPLYPRTAGQTLTYIMTSRSTSLEPKSQLIIILALGKQQKKIPNQRVGESKTKERKFPIKDRKKTEEICRKGLWTRQHLNNTELSPSKQEKKGNHDLKWSSPFDCQPKSCALATFLPRTRQKQKRKRPKQSEPNSSPKHHSRKSPIDPWSHITLIW